MAVKEPVLRELAPLVETVEGLLEVDEAVWVAVCALVMLVLVTVDFVPVAVLLDDMEIKVVMAFDVFELVRIVGADETVDNVLEVVEVGGLLKVVEIVVLVEDDETDVVFVGVIVAATELSTRCEPELEEPSLVFEPVDLLPILKGNEYSIMLVSESSVILMP